jgi:hypothetical protein
MPLRHWPKCLICGDVSVSKKTRPKSFEEEGGAASRRVYAA